MTVAVGDQIPNVTIKTMGANGPEDLNTGDFFADKKVVLFAVCLLYTSPSPRDGLLSRMPSSA